MSGTVSQISTGKEKHTVHWFRKGLRLHDNPSLKEGLKEATTFRCVFVLDPWFAGSSSVGINKWSCKALDKEGVTIPSSVLVNVICERLGTLDPGFVIPVNVRVTDVNDNAPVFINAPYILNISEVTVVGTRVLQGVHAVDNDQQGLFSTVKYSVLPGQNSDFFEFENEMEGTLVLKKPLDYESLKSFDVHIRAEDHGDPPKKSDTVLTVNVIDADDQNPKFLDDRFLLQCLEDLDRNLRKLNSRLFVIRGQPADALPKLFKEWSTTALTFEEDPEPFGGVRDHNITALCNELGITVTQRISHTLYNLEDIIERNGGKAPLTYNQFLAIVASIGPPPKPEIPVNASMLNGAYTPLTDDHDEKFGVPTLEELGFDTEGLNPPVWQGGESESLARLERHLERKAWVASFGRPKMTPQSLLPSQTGLSPYLRFGCLSTRLFYYQLTDLYKKIKKAFPPLSLHGQLLWREFFYCAATKNSNFDKMYGNPICVQIPWDKNIEALAKWANGQTGFPWIDAIMTQLRQEGWIHHVARHAVACFLTRGDLWISWEEGMKVFDELLLDADWSVNAGMWMWLSCSSFFQQFFHCYCPIKFGRKADPNGDYIRKYLPVLKNMPFQYIHEPWQAPEKVQLASKCIIGKDYPLPMVNHAVINRINIQRMRQVYEQLGNYKLVDNGRYKENIQQQKNVSKDSAV